MSKHAASQHEKTWICETKSIGFAVRKQCFYGQKPMLYMLESNAFQVLKQCFIGYKSNAL